MASINQSINPSTSTDTTTSPLGKQSQSRRNNPTKRVQVQDTAHADNDNQCCVCFKEYVEGDEWIRCSCDR